MRACWRMVDEVELDEDIGGSLAAGIVLLLLYVNLYVNEEADEEADAVNY